MLTIACDEAGRDIGISLSLAGETIEENIDLLRHAEAVGVTHALVSYPQAFVPRTHEDVYEFVRAIADATNLGLTLFVASKFAFTNLHPSGVPFEAYERLADLDNVVAMKLGGMDAGMILESFERFSDRLLVTSTNFGMLPMLVQTFGLQWSGGWTVEALQSPEQRHAVQFLDLLAKGRFDEAMEIYWNLTPALGTMLRIMAPSAATGAYHWPMLKFQQWLSGGNGGMTRSALHAPLRPGHDGHPERTCAPLASTAPTRTRTFLQDAWRARWSTDGRSPAASQGMGADGTAGARERDDPVLHAGSQVDWTRRASVGTSARRSPTGSSRPCASARPA